MAWGFQSPVGYHDPAFAGCSQREILPVPTHMAWVRESQPGFREALTHGQLVSQAVIRVVLLFLSTSLPAKQATADVVDIANLVAMASPGREPVPPQFVQVSEEGTHFVLNGRPFFFAGANCYYLMVGTHLSCYGLVVAVLSLG